MIKVLTEALEVLSLILSSMIYFLLYSKRYITYVSCYNIKFRTFNPLSNTPCNAKQIRTKLCSVMHTHIGTSLIFWTWVTSVWAQVLFLTVYISVYNFDRSLHDWRISGRKNTTGGAAHVDVHFMPSFGSHFTKKEKRNETMKHAFLFRQWEYITQSSPENVGFMC